MSSEFRAYLKPKGANPEIDSSYYELSSHQLIHGMWNCEVLTQGFTLGDFTSQMLFRPVDQKKPIVFAIDGVTSGCFFIFVDAHTPGKKHDRMVNFKPYKTDKYIIACDDGGGIGKKPRDYWSITTRGATYVYGHPFPGTWKLSSVDLLCAFVGGDITADQLRAAASRHQSEVVKEMRREERIRFHVERERQLLVIIDEKERRVSQLDDEKHVTDILIRMVRAAVNESRLPGILRSKLLKHLSQYDAQVVKTNRGWSKQT